MKSILETRSYSGRGSGEENSRNRIIFRKGFRTGVFQKQDYIQGGVRVRSILETRSYSGRGSGEEYSRNKIIFRRGFRTGVF